MWGRISFIFRQREFWLALIAFSAIGVIFWAFSRQLIYILHQGDIAREWILGFGFWAPLAYIGLFAMQILIAPMPGQFLGVMSGFVFGVFLGSFYSIVALTIGAGLAMYIARRFGRPLLERFVEPDQLRLWERKLYMRSPVNWGLLFVFPVPDFVFYLAGLSSIPLIRLVPAIIALDFSNILLGYGAYFLLGRTTLPRDQRGALWFVALCTPIYWFMQSIAAWRAVFQLRRDPYLWEKTPHPSSRDVPAS